MSASREQIAAAGIDAGFEETGTASKTDRGENGCEDDVEGRLLLHFFQSLHKG